MIWPPKFKYTWTLKIAYLRGFELFDSFNWPDKNPGRQTHGEKKEAVKDGEIGLLPSFFLKVPKQMSDIRRSL